MPQGARERPAGPTVGRRRSADRGQRGTAQRRRAGRAETTGGRRRSRPVAVGGAPAAGHRLAPGRATGTERGRLLGGGSPATGRRARASGPGGRADGHGAVRRGRAAPAGDGPRCCHKGCRRSTGWAGCCSRAASTDEALEGARVRRAVHAARRPGSAVRDGGADLRQPGRLRARHRGAAEAGRGESEQRRRPSPPGGRLRPAGPHRWRR